MSAAKPPGATLQGHGAPGPTLRLVVDGGRVAPGTLEREPPAPARLLIQASAPPRPPDPVLPRLLRWLPTRRPRGQPPAAAPPLALEIHDLQGRQVLALADARPMQDLPLPPGTYQVTVSLGPLRRGYTMTLEAGVMSRLNVHFESPHP